MRNRDVVVVTLVPFALTLALYLFTLAPSVTFEDSGELAAAAYNLGVPHPPGYPVFCMVGKLFTLLPFGNVAWRLNFMSAFFTALSSAVLAWAVLLLLRRLARSGAGEGRDRPRPPYVLAAAIAAGIMAGIAFEAWEQALITEVYGLNSFVLTLDLLLLVSWELAPSLQRQRFFYALCFTLGLGLVVHPISIVFLPLALVYIALVDVRYLFKARRLLAGALYFALGISPVLYLPVVSRTEPIMDWGDPETFRNFFLVVTRGLIPYETHELSKTIGQLGYYFHLLVRQWFPVLLVPALLGFLALLRRSRRHFWIAVAFLLLTAPLVTVTTNINVTTGQPEVIDGNKWIASVFYIPSYICLSLTAGIGFWYIGAGLTRLLRNAGAAALAIILLPAGLAFFTYGRVDMSHYYFARDYAYNVFHVAEKDALVIAQYDPEFFPLVYYQDVEHERPDLVIVNPLLLMRSWYIGVLKNRHPDLVAASAREAAEFLRALEPFEKKQAYDGMYIQTKFDALLNSFIDKAVAGGRSVYTTSPLTGAVAAGYQKESLAVTLRLRRQMAPVTPLDLGELRLRSYEVPSAKIDFPARYMKRRIWSLLLMRGNQLKAAGQKADADRFFEEAGKLRE